MHIIRMGILMAKYYLIWRTTLGKREDDKDYLFVDGEWVEDEKHAIEDLLDGKDSHRYLGFSWLNLTYEERISEITREKALNCIAHETMTSRKWNHMIRLVNAKAPRSEAEKYFSEAEMTLFDSSMKDLLELRKKYPGACFWPVETDW